MTDRAGERPEPPEPLPSPVADSHCHLDLAAAMTGLEVADAIALAAAVGVTRIVQVGCDVGGSAWAVEAAERWDSVVAAVALHPNEAAGLGAQLPNALAEIERLAGRPEVRAVGETGLDFYRTPEPAGQSLQRDSFAAHISWAKAYDKTLMIHDREAHAAVLDVLDAEGSPDRIVMHCFSGDADFARACLDRGAFLSFAGTVTFKNAEPLRDALRITPLDQVLIETDAPFLTPTPFRGRPNASYLIPHTARLMAEVLALDLAQLCQALNGNTSRAFGGELGLAVEFDDVVRRRRMVRRYDADRPVPAEALDAILSVALRAPSAGHTQAVSFLVLQGSAETDRFWSLTAGSGEPDRWLRGMRAAPVLVLVWTSAASYLDRYAQPDKGWVDRNPARWSAPYWYVDAGMASMAALLAAVDRELGACFFGVPADRQDGVRAAYGVPPDQLSVGVLSLGYPDATAARHPSRPRRDRSERVHLGRWSGS